MSKMEKCLSLSTASVCNPSDCSVSTIVEHDFDIRRLEEKSMNNYDAMIADALTYVMEKGSPLTMCEFEKLIGFHFTINHTEKMEGMASASSACVVNPICIARSKVEGSICQKCFAKRMFKRYKDNFNCFIDNYELVTSVEIPQELMPIMNYFIFRIEAFGDVANETQAKNYWNLATQNGDIGFGWWTKNYEIVAPVFDKYGKPDNVTLVVSSPMLNEQLNIEDYPYADKIMTIYTRKYLKTHKVDINCKKGDKCLLCKKCYKKDNGIKYINEIQK